MRLPSFARRDALKLIAAAGLAWPALAQAQQPQNGQQPAQASRHLVLRLGLITEAQITPGQTILGDRNLIAQVLSNLLDNAIKYSPVGSVVEIDIQTDLEIECLAAQLPEFVKIDLSLLRLLRQLPKS